MINVGIGVGAIALLLFALLLFILRKPIKSFFKKRKTSRTDSTRSIWRGESMTTTARAPASDVPRQTYILPRVMKQQSALVLPLRLNPDNQGERIVSVNTVMRQERLGLVRDLPPSRQLDIEVTREVEQATERWEKTFMAQGGGILDEKDKTNFDASARAWDNTEIAAKRQSVAESEASLRKWRTPVSWVRDQRRRGWGSLSG